MTRLAWAPLQGLSLVRATGRVPPVLTNDQRAQLLRAVLPAPTYNEHDWPHCQAQRYAAEQTEPDPDYFTTHSYTELTGGF